MTHPPPVLLLYSTDAQLLRHFGTALQSRFTVRVANNPERALRAAGNAPRPDHLLLGPDVRADDAAALQACLPAVPAHRLALPVHVATLCATLCAALQPDLPRTASLAGRRALVAEDDPLLQQALCEQLASLDVQTVTAGDGRQVLALTGRERFDWILLDVQMPVMDGLETVRHLRADVTTADLCVIAVTGSGDEQARTECTAAGMSDFLVKPMPTEQLQATLNAWLDRAHADVPAVPPAASDALSALDFGKLHELGRGDPARMLKFATQFLHSLDAGFAAIDSGLACNDLAEVASQAHRLKSNARWIGGLVLGDALAALEQAAAAGEPRHAAECMATCRSASAAFLPALRSALAQLASLDPTLSPT